MNHLVGYLPEPVYHYVPKYQNIPKFTIAILENIQKHSSHFGVLPICIACIHIMTILTYVAIFPYSYHCLKGSK